MKSPGYIALAAVGLVMIAVAANSWLGARRDLGRLTATVTAQNTVIEQAAAREKQRHEELNAALAEISAAKRRIQSPQQAASAIPAALPPLPLPVSIHLPDLSAIPPSPTPQEPAQLNGGPATLTIPQPDLKPLHDALLDCRACALERDAAQKDVADQQLRITALTIQRDAAIAAARGGSFWSRVKHATKWFIIGAAAGAAATAAARH